MDKSLAKYRLPSRIIVNVERTPEGTFYAKLPELPGCLTEADTPLDLILQVSDAVLTYFDVPRKVAKGHGVVYFPPENYLKKFTAPEKKDYKKPKAQFYGKFGFYYPHAFS